MSTDVHFAKRNGKYDTFLRVGRIHFNNDQTSGEESAASYVLNTRRFKVFNCFRDPEELESARFEPQRKSSREVNIFAPELALSGDERKGEGEERSTIDL